MSAPTDPAAHALWLERCTAASQAKDHTRHPWTMGNHVPLDLDAENEYIEDSDVVGPNTETGLYANETWAESVLGGL